MRPELSSQESLRKSGSFSKAPPRCPAKERQFSQPEAKAKARTSEEKDVEKIGKKPPKTGGF
jgi:hypothetical protein